ncbi:hypothetical protein B0A48_00931 [Cryoendolithus antarcticus]|uniref:Uncharacterized protein n=1 Tax=Cryoendolithus antarcticus TaxID=1507870 RepID=A0A1V8TRS0_9PEZI|nr:hypothetical protein B0A48_00931 [Cryoendolithus antarcticus]
MADESQSHSDEHTTDPIPAAAQCMNFYSLMAVWMYLHHADRPKEAVIFTRLFAQILRCDTDKLMDMVLSTVQTPLRDLSYDDWKAFDAFIDRLERGKRHQKSKCLLLAARSLDDVSKHYSRIGYVELAETWRSFGESMQLYADEFRDREYAEIRRKDKLKAQRKLDMQVFDDFGPEWMELWLLEGLNEPPSPPSTTPPPPPVTRKDLTKPPRGMCPTRLYAWKRQRMMSRAKGPYGPDDPNFQEAIMQFAKEYPEAWEVSLQPNGRKERVFTDAVVKFAKENPQAFGPGGAELLEAYYNSETYKQSGT